MMHSPGATQADQATNGDAETVVIVVTSSQ